MSNEWRDNFLVHGESTGENKFGYGVQSNEIILQF